MFKQFSLILLFFSLFFSLCKTNIVTANQVLSDEWLGIYFKGEKLGFLHSTTLESDLGYSVKITSYIKTESFGSTQEISFISESSFSKDFKAKNFLLIQEMMENKQKIVGTVKNTTLTVETFSAGTSTTTTIPFPENSYLSSGVMLMVIKNGLAIGKHYKVNLYIEALQSFVPSEIKIIGREEITYNGKTINTFILEETMRGLSSKMWLTETGDTIKQTSFEGFEFKKEDEKTAMDFKKGIVPVASLTALTLIQAESSIENAAKVSDLTITISTPYSPSFIKDHRQHILKKETIGTDTFVTMNISSEKISPKHHTLAFPVTNPSFKDSLAADHIIQSRHPDIVQKAKEIIGDKKNAWEAVQAINQWVFTTMKKKPIDSFSALEALKSGTGECQAHTNLFTALARSVGIPTKIVSGISYSPYYTGFIYHAWPEVFVGEWVAVDPTLGEEVADATHLKLTEGSGANHLDLLQYIGQMNIVIDGYTQE